MALGNGACSVAGVALCASSANREVVCACAHTWVLDGMSTHSVEVIYLVCAPSGAIVVVVPLLGRIVGSFSQCCTCVLSLEPIVVSTCSADRSLCLLVCSLPLIQRETHCGLSWLDQPKFLGVALIQRW